MSTTRCKHGNVIGDTMGSYACTECDPASRIEELEAEVERLTAELARKDASWTEMFNAEEKAREELSALHIKLDSLEDQLATREELVGEISTAATKKWNETLELMTHATLERLVERFGFTRSETTSHMSIVHTTSTTTEWCARLDVELDGEWYPAATATIRVTPEGATGEWHPIELPSC